MHRALTLLTATAFLSTGCAARTAPPRDATTLAPERAAPAASAPAGSEPPAHLILAAGLPPLETEKPSPTPPDEAHGSDALPRAMGWFSLAFGASAGVVAIGTSFMMIHQANVRGADCNSAKVCSADGLNANAQLNGLAGWNIASYVAAAAGIGVGTILLITNPKSERQTAIDVTPTNGGAGLLLRSTF